MSARIKSLGVLGIIVCVALSGLNSAQIARGDPPSWAIKIMEETFISGLVRENEIQKVEYLGKGMWNNTVEAWYFVVWRLHKYNEGWERDLQAHIELAKIGEDLYKMEIYHSWDTLIVEMPFEHETNHQEDYLLVLRIQAEV